MVMSLAVGRVPEAFLFNPLLFLVAVLGGFWLGCRLVFRYQLRVVASGGGKRFLWLVVFGAIGLNWLYLALTDFGAAWR